MQVMSKGKVKMVRLDTIFKADYGQREYTSKNHLIPVKGGTPLISSKGTNNGIYGYYDIQPKYKHVISVPRTGQGTVGFAIYQPNNCCIDDNCLVLEPICELNQQEMIYYSLLIRLDRYRYAYGRQVTPERIGQIEVIAPSDIPSWVKSTEIKDISYYQGALSTTLTPPIDLMKWKPFKVVELFENIVQCKCGNAGALINGNDIWYIGAKKKENGLMKKVKRVENLVTKGNCIIMIGDGQGSVGYANYMDKDFIGSTTLYAGYSDNLDRYVGLFLSAMFSANRFRYNYGRKWNGGRLLNSEILLPVVLDNKGVPVMNEYMKFTPDYDYMRNYIKTLPFTKNIEKKKVDNTK